MARSNAGGLNVGRAAFLIVVGLLIGVFVLSQDGRGGSTASVRSTPSIPIPDFTTSTTTRRLAVPTTAPLRAPGSFKSVAINATNTDGVAAKATERLRTSGYNPIAPGSAPASVRAATKTSSILFVAGFNAEALKLAEVFGLPPTAIRPMTSPPSPAVKDASLVVLVGPDLKF